MKICVATDVHPAHDPRIIKEIKSLKKIGEVFYISPPGNPGIEVKHIQIPLFKSRKERIMKGPREVFRIVQKIKPNIFHFHDPELIPIGIKIAKLGIKVVYDIHENYPAVFLTKNYVPKILRPILAWSVKTFEDYGAKYFAGVVAVTENVCERFSRKIPCALVPNYPDIKFLGKISRKRVSDGKTRFIYVGSIDQDRAIIEMLTAYKMISEKYENVEFLLVGTIFSKKLQKFIEEFHAKGFTYHPPVAYEKSLQIVADSDVGMLVIHRNESKEISSPVKMFEYMYYGLPIIASDFSYWHHILDRGPCAVYVEPDDPISIANAMRKLINHNEREKLSCQSIAKEFTWEKCESNLLNLYKNLK